MPFEQEPIKIEIPPEEEATPAFVPEQRRAPVSERLGDAGRDIAGQAREAWDSEARREAQEKALEGLSKSAEVSRAGFVRGLRWMSERLASLAARLTPEEKTPQE